MADRRLNALDMEIAALRADITAGSRELAAMIAREQARLATKIAALEEEKRQVENYAKELAALAVTPEAVEVRSTAAGTLDALAVQPGDMVKKGDVIAVVTVPQGRVVVHGYFDMQDYGALAKGKTVTVLFPDGESGRGRIKTLHAAADTYVKRLMNGYVPLAGAVFVEVAPVDAAEGRKWKKYNNLDVQLKVL